MFYTLRENWIALVITVALSLVTVQLVTEPPFMAAVRLSAEDDMMIATTQTTMANKTFSSGTIINARLADLQRSDVPNGSVRYVTDERQIVIKVNGLWLPITTTISNNYYDKGDNK